MSNPIGTFIADALRPWFTKKLQTQPDFIIGPTDDPYMYRWYVIPKNRWFNIYLHQFHRSDEPRAEHDHPWHSLSLILDGCVHEIYGNPADNIRAITKGQIVYRSAKFTHRIVFHKVLNSLSKYAHTLPITLFITGPKIRDWGFHCPKGWVPWQQFTSDTPENKRLTRNSRVGRGCGEE